MIKCPVCDDNFSEAEPDFGSCNTCGWEHDPVQLVDPDYSDGANHLSLNDCRAKWEREKHSA